MCNRTMLHQSTLGASGQLISAPVRWLPNSESSLHDHVYGGADIKGPHPVHVLALLVYQHRHFCIRVQLQEPPRFKLGGILTCKWTLWIMEASGTAVKCKQCAALALLELNPNAKVPVLH